MMRTSTKALRRLLTLRQIVQLLCDATTGPTFTTKTYSTAIGYADFPRMRICNYNDINRTKAAELGMSADVVTALQLLNSDRRQFVFWSEVGAPVEQVREGGSLALFQTEPFEFVFALCVCKSLSCTRV